MSSIKYGTSGFRDQHMKIERIAEKIGIAMALLVNFKKESFGIMITASHNHYNDNGVKIMDQHGHMVGKDDEHYLENYVNNMFEDTNNNSIPPYSPLIRIFNKDLEYLEEKKKTLVIGYDSRESSPKICELIVRGIMKCNENFPYFIMPLITTPELHFNFSSINMKYSKYVQKISQKIYYNCIVDCANGIGGKKMSELRHPSLTLLNTSWTDHEKLNVNCSSDFVCSAKKMPHSVHLYNDDEKLRASLDGDADRVVFYYGTDEKINILNGDYIAALIITYLSNVLQDYNEELTIGFVHTGYTNSACLEYIQKLSFPKRVQLTCASTPTGVKYLHDEAVKYDIGVYFEQNGHGNVLFQKKILQLEPLSSCFHPNIGDGILDLFATLYILQELDMSPKEWYYLYKENFSIMSKQKVQDKEQFKCFYDEQRLSTPKNLQEDIDNICDVKDSSCRAFVRPSGTENVVRLYVEGKTEGLVQEIHEKISQIIKEQYE